MMFNRTLLREEGDGDEDTILEKRKKDRERNADAERRKKLGNRKTSPAPDVYFNSAVTGIDDAETANQMVSLPIQNLAQQQQQKTPRQHLPQVQAPVHQQIAKIPPPPTLQHRTAVQYQPTASPHVEAPFQSQQQMQGQQYSSHPPHQLNYPAVQHAQTTIPQMPVYSNQAVQQHSAVQRTQSVPVQQQVHEYPSQRGQSHHHSTVSSKLQGSTPSVTESQDTWHTSADSTQDSWRGAQESAGGNGILNSSDQEIQWAAFSPVLPPVGHMGVQQLDEEHSSSEDEMDNRSSPILLGEEGDVLLRAPSLTSFAESISSIEDESEDNTWRILPDQRDYYTKQFQRLQPVDGGVVKGPRARDFFMKSSLPTDTLSKIWHLSDRNKDNALNLDEFCIAMHLVVALRHGLDLPATLPAVLLPEKKDTVDPFTVPDHSVSSVTTTDHQQHRQLYSPEELLATPSERQDSGEDYTMKRRSFSDTSTLDESMDSSHRRVSVPATQTPQALDHSQVATPLSPGHTGTSEIARPRAVAKPSLLDAAPGQLLPPPSGKQAREGWTPIKPGQFVIKPHAAPLFPEPMSSPSSPVSTPPTSPLSPIETVLPASPESLGSPEEVENKEEVTAVKRRSSKRTTKRPRSTGDVNKVVLKDKGPTRGSTSDGKREPPPPPPRKKGHSRASSLDLNKLFAAKAKESQGTSSVSSNSSSQSSQNSEGPIPEVKSEDLPTQGEVAEKPGECDAQEERPTSPSQENFADFSKFDNFVMAQGSTSETKVKRLNLSDGKPHRRSLSLDFDQVPASSGAVQPVNRGPASQEALPRPVSKKKPTNSPALKLRKTDRTSERSAETERKLNTEPPKVVVRPLTMEDMLQSQIRDLKEKNVTLSRLNNELQQELKEVMESRVSLELKLERLKL